VEVVRPLVDVRGPWLDGLRPSAVTCHARDTTGHEDAHHLRGRDVDAALDHQQVHHVLGVRKARPPPARDRHRTVEPQGADAFARGGHVARVRVEAVDEVAVARAEEGGEPALAAPDVDDEAALDARVLQDILR
jgi:hypothetical protein